MILYFSGCGNSRHIAEGLGRLTGDSVNEMKIKESVPTYNIEPGESLGIVCPVYAWAVPRVVRDYVKRLSLNRIPSYCYLACTCGDNVGKTPEQFETVVNSRGWHLDAAYSFVMPETYINLAGFKLDSPENERKKIAEADKRLSAVAEAIMHHKKVIDVTRGKMAWFNTHITNSLFYSILITDKKFHTTNECISCGVCAKSCPLGNITMESGRPKWHGGCTNCMSCYHHCPKNAIHFGKATKGKGRYYYGHNEQ